MYRGWEAAKDQWSFWLQSADQTSREKRYL